MARQAFRRYHRGAGLIRRALHVFAGYSTSGELALGSSQVSAMHACPPFLYRYRSMSSPAARARAREIVVDSRLYCAALHTFDDPYEARFVSVPDSSFAEDYRASLETEFSACCFSEPADHALLWSLYADGHRGICLEFSATHPHALWSTRNQSSMTTLFQWSTFASAPGKTTHALSTFERPRPGDTRPSGDCSAQIHRGRHRSRHPSSRL